MSDRPIVLDNNGHFRQLPLSEPLQVGTPEENNHAVTLEVLQQLIKEKQETNE
jgi:hypothetical protein